LSLKKPLNNSLFDISKNIIAEPKELIRIVSKLWHLKFQSLLKKLPSYARLTETKMVYVCLVNAGAV